MTDGPGFLLDVDRCTGCRACELACSTENALDWERSWRSVVTVNEARMPGIPTFHLSVACNHCRDAPCVKECPARALGRNPLTGAVLVDAAACIGCGYCGWVCPWDAPRFDGPDGVMDKCTMCDHRLVDGLEPACVVACPTAALGWGPPLRRPGGNGTPQGFPDADVGPRIAFAPRRGPAEGPRSTLAPELRRGTPIAAAGGRETGCDPGRGTGSDAIGGAATPMGPAAAPWAGTPAQTTGWSSGGDRSRRVGLRSEASLWLFTTVLACLVGWMGAAGLSGVTGRAVGLSAPVFLALLVSAAGVSVLHLGRRTRAWRVVLNVRRSRLSREVVAFGAFAVASGAALAWPGPGAPLFRWVAAVIGLATTFLVDRVYDPVRPSRRVGRTPPTGRAHGPARWPPAAVLHSADTIFIAPSVASLLLGSLPAFLALATVRAALFVRSGAARSDSPRDRRTSWRGPGGATLRLGVGLLAPAALLAALPAWPVGWPLAALLVGELLDRARFYEELRAPALGATAWSGQGRDGPATAPSARAGEVASGPV